MATKMITTKEEKELSNLLFFTGKSVDSLIKKAKKFPLEGETIPELLKNIKKILKARRVVKAQTFGMSLLKYDRLQRKAIQLLNSFNTHHSMGCYRSIIIKYKGRFMTFAENNILKTYASSCKYAPTYGSITISLTVKELEAIENIDGLWTIKLPDGRAKWLESKGRLQYYEIRFFEGFLFGSTHSEISLKDAENGEVRKLQAIISAIKNDRQFIGYQHVREAGACDPGIRSYCERNNLNIDFGYNLGYLKSLEKSRYLERIKK
ncbi:hypothetical protein CLV98_12313 [Dyadobacter jejuensis]|uniref:Uncharacterized protein n=2 Tax=Dyadobacter jejuensis TaxID=1082580 RepID=A0A316A8U2_9BACT|nr:hypothetical protein CLV98_12313 [Dyadobacter jejuensis]